MIFTTVVFCTVCRTSDVEHLFMCSLPICLSTLVKCLFEHGKCWIWLQVLGKCHAFLTIRLWGLLWPVTALTTSHFAPRLLEPMSYGACCELQDSLLLRYSAQVHTPRLIFLYLVWFTLVRLLEGRAIIIQGRTKSRQVAKVISVTVQNRASSYGTLRPEFLHGEPWALDSDDLNSSPSSPTPAVTAKFLTRSSTASFSVQGVEKNSCFHIGSLCRSKKATQTVWRRVRGKQ